MNKTQKSAIYCLSVLSLCITICIYIVIKIYILKSLPGKPSSTFWMVMYFLITVPSLIFLRKKQSPNEPDADERDDLIKKRAVVCSFVSVWISLVITSIAPWFIVGPEVSIPAWAIPLINLPIFLIAAWIYSIAVLVQYGRGDKDGKK